MVDRTIKKPMGIVFDVLAKVENLVFPTDFIILDYKVNVEIPKIFGQ